MPSVNEYLGRVDEQVDRFMKWIDHPDRAHELTRDVATIMPSAPFRDRMRLWVQAHFRNIRPRLFGTREQWEAAGIEVNRDARPLLMGGSTPYWRLDDSGPNQPTRVVQERVQLPLVVLYEVSDTDAADSKALQPSHLGQGASRLVTGKLLYEALKEVGNETLQPAKHPLLQFPNGHTVEAKVVHEAALHLGVSMTRAEVWGLPPDRSIDEPRAVWKSPANNAGAVTELVFMRATALTLPIVDAYRDLRGDGNVRPQRQALLQPESNLQMTRDLYTQLNTYQQFDIDR